MKLTIPVFLSAAIILLISCNNDNNYKSEMAAVKETSVPDVSSHPDYKKGLELVVKSDCLTCHKLNDKLIGPSYADVANKYPSTPENITRLAHNVIKGVSADKAIWGKLPMTPHPQISQADAEQMVKYVLLLKKQ